MQIGWLVLADPSGVVRDADEITLSNGFVKHAHCDKKRGFGVVAHSCRY